MTNIGLDIQSSFSGENLGPVLSTSNYISVLYMHVLYSSHSADVCGMQPHGFFNCSPAVDVPPSACELNAKDNDAKDNSVSKPLQNGVLAKL
jgi:hypothetical protein